MGKRIVTLFASVPCMGVERAGGFMRLWCICFWLFHAGGGTACQEKCKYSREFETSGALSAVYYGFLYSCPECILAVY